MKLMPQLCDLALFEPMGDAALKQVRPALPKPDTLSLQPMRELQ